MKVLYTGTLDVNFGGPAFSTYNTMRGLNAIGIETHVLMYALGKEGKLIGKDVPIHFASKPLEHIFAYSPFYKKAIKKCGDFDIYQANQTVNDGNFLVQISNENVFTHINIVDIHVFSYGRYDVCNYVS